MEGDGEPPEQYLILVSPIQDPLQPGEMQHGHLDLVDLLAPLKEGIQLSKIGGGVEIPDTFTVSMGFYEAGAKGCSSTPLIRDSFSLASRLSTASTWPVNEVLSQQTATPGCLGVLSTK